MRHRPFWEKGFALFKTRQLLLQLDLRQSISVIKKKMVRGSPSPPLVPTCSCLAIHLPRGLSHCTPDSLTRCWEAASHTLTTVHRRCTIQHTSIVSHRNTDIPKPTGNDICIAPWAKLELQCSLLRRDCRKYFLFDHICYAPTVESVCLVVC